MSMRIAPGVTPDGQPCQCPCHDSEMEHLGPCCRPILRPPIVWVPELPADKEIDWSKVTISAPPQPSQSG